MFRTSLLLVSLLIGLSYTFHFANTRCHEGPSYWCSSHEVAESCQATEFCQMNYWSDKYDEESENLENFITCKACTFTFSEMEKYIFSEKNEEKIIAATSKLCKRIPASMTETCKTFLKTYGKLALDTVAEKISASSVCTAIGMCDKASYESVLLGKPAEETCDTCRSMTVQISQDLKQLVAWWSDHCDETDDTASCLETTEYASIIFDLVFSNELCDEMQMC